MKGWKNLEAQEKQQRKLRLELLWGELRSKIEAFYVEQPQFILPDVDHARCELRQAVRTLSRVVESLNAAATCSGTRLADGLVADAARDATFALGSVAAATEALGGGRS